MPIYEYHCDACGTRIEVMQKISDRPLRHCPGCKKNKLRKLVSATAFRLKGSGWYETDFKKDGKKNLHGISDGADTKPEKAADGAVTKETKESTDKPAPKDKTGGKDKPSTKAKAKKPAAD